VAEQKSALDSMRHSGSLCSLPFHLQQLRCAILCSCQYSSTG